MNAILNEEFHLLFKAIVHETKMLFLIHLPWENHLQKITVSVSVRLMFYHPVLLLGISKLKTLIILLHL
jgi:hypothetical protein